MNLRDANGVPRDGSNGIGHAPSQVGLPHVDTDACDGATPIPGVTSPIEKVSAKRHAVTARVTAENENVSLAALDLVLAGLPSGVASLLRTMAEQEPEFFAETLARQGGIAALLDSTHGASPQGGLRPPGQKLSPKGEARNATAPDSACARVTSELVTDLVGSLEASRDLVLSYVTLTCREGQVIDRESLRAFVPDAWWACDYRPADVDPSHAHGFVLLPKVNSSAVVTSWCEQTGASRDAQRFQIVSGWKRFAGKRHSTHVLQQNLVRVVGYCLKLGKHAPAPAQRDLSRDVLASGVFASWWPHHVAALASALQSEAPVALHAKHCERAGCSKRVDSPRATYCSSACRTRAYRARRDVTTRDPSHAVTQPQGGT